MTPQHPPASLYRTTEGLGLWEHRGKVAAVGVGHSPTARRWDGTPETCVGAWSILALRRAMADAGVSPDQIDALVLDPVTTTGAYWPAGAPIPLDVVNAFHPTSDPLDGIAQLSAEWLLQNMPELTNIQFVMYGPRCMSPPSWWPPRPSVRSHAYLSGAQELAQLRRSLLPGWGSGAGRHRRHECDQSSLGHPGILARRCNLAGILPQVRQDPRHDGSLYYQLPTQRPDVPGRVLGAASAGALDHGRLPGGAVDRQASEPLDNDIPIWSPAAYLFTTPERAKDMRTSPSTSSTMRRAGPPRSLTPTLEEVEAETAKTGRKLYEGAGIPRRISPLKTCTMASPCSTSST
jgi:hypothetical protein